LIEEVEKFFASQQMQPMTALQKDLFLRGLDGMKQRAKTLPELIDMAHFILSERPFKPDERAAALLDSVSRGMLNRLTSRLQHVTWTEENLETEIREFAEAEGLKLGKVAQPLRAALCGRTVSPSVFDMMVLIGKEETLARLADTAA
ncbi:MAG TPA: glutamate--tRNA ligase, partial [Paracoccaceae bacterium]|nr:glutamate--tRNA ligase [Paracoccaceae bacterium]